jgi:hypothetical protein
MELLSAKKWTFTSVIFSGYARTFDFCVFILCNNSKNGKVNNVALINAVKRFSEDNCTGAFGSG